MMKRRAGMMVDLLLADFAAEHLDGNYGGGHSRDYPDDIINPLCRAGTCGHGSTSANPGFEQWNEARYRPRHRGSWETVFGALSSYRLPQSSMHMATDRSKPYVHTETQTGPQCHPVRRGPESAGVQVHVHDARLRAGISAGRHPAADSAAHVGCDVSFAEAEQHDLHPASVRVRARAGDVLPGRAEVPCRGGRPVSQGLHEPGQVELPLSVRADIPAQRIVDRAL